MFQLPPFGGPSAVPAAAASALPSLGLEPLPFRVFVLLEKGGVVGGCF